jgi:hypothetical protein
LTWYYADRARLLHPAVPAKLSGFAVRITLAPIIVYLLAIAVSFASLNVSLALFAAVPAFFILPHRFVAGHVGEAITASDQQPG